MDCGPAALKCLLEGFGVAVSYGRLREACQTDVDGTSIDTLEELAKQLGLDAEQVMLPLDHLLRAESDTLPALVVVKLPTGFTHFVVVWRRHGRFVQVMDPASGRRWLSSAQFLKDVYVHELRVPAAAWYEWARSEEFLAPLDRRLVAVGLGHAAQGLLKEATESPDWSALATLDAATHLTASLIRARGIVSGREASGVLRALLDRARAPGSSDSTDLLTIPSIYWSARPAPAIEGDSTSPIGEEIHLKGAVLIRARGRLSHHAGATTPSAQDAAADAAAPPDTTHADAPSPLSPELAAALAEPPSRPGRELLRLLQGDGIFSLSVLAGG
ncbi:MAG: cysteine peptidase family C39 domain-containing protein, partial [bacterium]